MSKSSSEKFFDGLSVQTIVTITLAIIELFYFAIMSRLLTKTEFGYYAACMAVMSVITSISEAGLGAAIIQKKNGSERFVSTAFVMSILLGVFFSIFVFVSSPWLGHLVADETLVLPLKLMSLTILPHSLTSIGNALLYKKLDFKHIGFNSVISFFISSIIAIVCALNGLGLMSVVIYSISVPTINFILVFLLNVRFPRIQFDFRLAKDIFSFGGWLTISTVVNNLAHQIDKLVLPRWMSVSMLGAYNRPAGFINTASSKVNSIFDSVLFPMLSDIQDDSDKVIKVLYRAVSLLNSISVIFALLFIANAELIIIVFFGKGWLDLIHVFQILSISLIFNVNNRLVDCFFRSLKHVRLSFMLRVVFLCLTFLAVYIGSRINMVAVAIGVVSANVFTILLKLLCLSVKTKASFGILLMHLFSSWKAIIPLFALFVLYLLLPFQHNLLACIVYALLQMTVVVFQFFIFPKTIGREYENTVYPWVIQKVNRFRNIIFK